MKSFRKSISKTKPYLYIIPSFVFLAIFTYYPFVNSTYLRFFKYNLSTPDKAFAGLSNYVQILHDPLFWTVVKNNIVYASGTIVVSVPGYDSRYLGTRKHKTKGDSIRLPSFIPT